ncbi:MAG: DUF721 domain-containing protein [Alphaproteobacteria bacterium]|nr:DUF721 domain-containing protein [Alphaproteobacteria bacterium]
MMEKKRTKQQESEAPRRSSGLVSFGADVRKLLEPLLGKKGIIYADILAHWQDILGAELASGVTPFSVSFTKQKEGALLTVKAFGGAYAVEFTARKEQIKERLNFYFGYPAIADIRVQQGGTFTPPAPVKEETVFSSEKTAEMTRLTAGIENEALRESVIRLGLLLTDAKKD